MGATAPYDVIVGLPGGTTATGAEICHVTATNPGAKTITLTRGYAGTTPVTHLVLSILTHIITGEYLNALAGSGAPALHAATHATGGTDVVTLTEGQVTNLVGDLAAKAPLASPALTGTPTAPTAAPGTNTTQIASTAFVVANTGTPGLHASTHAAGGTDPVTLTEAQITNLTSDLAAKAALASPTFTGTPAAPTAAPGTNTTQLATTAFAAAIGAAAIPESQVTNLTADLAAKAPLASPTFTGVPAAPTAVGGTSTTQVATTAFVAGVVIPESQVTSLVSDLALKAPLASPALTGTPTAPTAAASTRTTQVATTAFAGAVGGRTTFSNAAYVAVAADKYIAQIGTLSASRIVTMPAANAVAAGYMIFVEDESGSVTNVNTIVCAGAGADTISGNTTISEAYRPLRLTSDGVSKWTADWNFVPMVVDFTANGTTVIPAGCQTVQMIAVGAGGGGGSGRRGAAGTQRVGGGGGAGGATGMGVFQAADLGGAGTTLTVTVGAGGVGGAARTTDDTDGVNGSWGGNSAVSSSSTGAVFGAAGGVTGNGGTATAGAGGSATAGPNTFPNATGGQGGISATGFNGTVAQMSGAGAGGGGGISAANTHFAGGAGQAGAYVFGSANLGGAAGIVGGGNGASATVVRAGSPGGGSGGGGGANSAGAGGNGGNGIRGGGGGGGGASLNANNSGAGGNGGDGWIRVIYQ